VAGCCQSLFCRSRTLILEWIAGRQEGRVFLSTLDEEGKFRKGCRHRCRAGCFQGCLLVGRCGAVFVRAGGGGPAGNWALVDLDFGSGISAALTVPAKCHDRIERRRLELK